MIPEPLVSNHRIRIRDARARRTGAVIRQEENLR
jgi:hypothetical protein